MLLGSGLSSVEGNLATNDATVFLGVPELGKSLPLTFSDPGKGESFKSTRFKIWKGNNYSS